MSDQIGEIPQSAALAEADAGSLTELMSRDPESYQSQDLARIIAALRADRARRELAEKTAGASHKPRASRADTSAAVPLNLSDLGL